MRGNPRDTVLKLRPYPWATARGEGELEEEKDEIRKLPRTYSTRWRLFTWTLGRTVSIRLRTAHTFFSPVPFADACLCRTLAAVFHCITVYKQPMLNYGAPSWLYGEITEYAKQTVVRELLLGQCCDDLFAIVAVSCMRL